MSATGTPEIPHCSAFGNNRSPNVRLTAMSGIVAVSAVNGSLVNHCAPGIAITFDDAHRVERGTGDGSSRPVPIGRFASCQPVPRISCVTRRPFWAGAPARVDSPRRLSIMDDQCTCGGRRVRRPTPRPSTTGDDGIRLNRIRRTSSPRLSPRRTSACHREAVVRFVSVDSLWMGDSRPWVCHPREFPTREARERGRTSRRRGVTRSALRRVADRSPLHPWVVLSRA